MKFTTQLADFQKFIQKLMPAVPIRSTIVALEYISLSLKGNELTAITSDNEVTIRVKLTVSGSEDGAILVPAKRINEIVKVLDATQELHVESNNNDFMIRITSGKARFNINGLDTSEYTDLPDILYGDVPTVADENLLVAYFKKDVIQKLADKTYFAVSQDEYRLNMSGVLLQFRESYVNAVSTDSFRLVRATAFAGDQQYPNDIDILVPARVIEICRKTDADVVMTLDTNQIKHSYLRIDFGNTTIVTHLINENFPKYDAIIPVTSNCQATFDVSDLLGAVRRVAPLLLVAKDAANKNKKCRLEFGEGKLKVITENEEIGEQAVEEIPAELIDETSFTITFNIKYLEEIIQNVTPNDTTNNLVTMFFITPDKAALIKPKSELETLVMILMPIRMS